MKSSIITFLKGLIIGSTMTVPGVSGGSMAMILGIYDKMISAVNRFFKEPKKNIIFLGLCVLGALLGMVLFSKGVMFLLDNFALPTRYFFIGAVAGGAPMIFKSSGVKKFSFTNVLYIVLGILLVSLIALIPEGVFKPGDELTLSNILIQVIGGIIIAAALVLPGISVSQMLLMLGLYEFVMESVGSLAILPLIPLAVGILLGTLLTAKGMDTAMQKFPKATYLIILGFIIGSLGELFPGVPNGIDILLCIITTIAGFFALYYISTKTEN